jgi:cytochrome c peroxidase
VNSALKSTALIVVAIWLSGCDLFNGTPHRWSLPPGFPEPVVPKDNPLTVERIELGRHLFYDKRLSANNTQSCGSCHQQAFAFSEARITSLGSTGQAHHRNSMTLTNVAYNATFTWAHPSITSIEQHILIPLFGDAPIEMGAGGHEAEILKRIESDPQYQELFAAAFPYRWNRINFDNVVKSIASFVRSMTSFDSPFDRYAYYQDDAALTESQVRGMNLFMSERLECAHCHHGFNFSQFSTHESAAVEDRAFHVTGLHPLAEEMSSSADYGLFAVTNNAADKHKFKAPTLRNIDRTAPYMHDGSVSTLREVLDFYMTGGHPHPTKSPFMKGFVLTPEEKDDVLNFLRSLTDEKFLQEARFSDPFSAVR